MFSLYINNDSNQYKQVNTTANRINLQLQPPIILDTKHNQKYQLRVISSNIVYCHPNITTKNNTFRYKYNNVWYDKTLPTGIYALKNINDTVARITNAQNGLQLFAFQANEATSTILIYFAYADTYIDCTSANSIMEILGYSSSHGVIGGVSANGFVETTEQAHLNTLQEIIIKCNVWCSNQCCTI